MKFEIGQRFSEKNTKFIRKVTHLAMHKGGQQLTLKTIDYTDPDPKGLAKRLIENKRPLTIFVADMQTLVDKGTFILQ